LVLLIIKDGVTLTKSPFGEALQHLSAIDVLFSFVILDRYKPDRESTLFFQLSPENLRNFDNFLQGVSSYEFL
jgi:hypothetical protein